MKFIHTNPAPTHLQPLQHGQGVTTGGGYPAQTLNVANANHVNVPQCAPQQVINIQPPPLHSTLHNIDNTRDEEGEYFDLRLKENFKLFISGPSRSGKTVFVKEMVRNLDIFSKAPPDIRCLVYKVAQPVYTEMCMDHLIQDGPNLKERLMELAQGRSMLVIFDDFLISPNLGELAELFTVDARHLKLSLIFITQRVFSNSNEFRQISLNSDYYCLFNNPRNKLEVRNLAAQMTPGKKELLKYYTEATKDPYSYLWLDLTQECKPAVRYLSHLFNKLHRVRAYDGHMKFLTDGRQTGRTHFKKMCFESDFRTFNIDNARKFSTQIQPTTREARVGAETVSVSTRDMGEGEGFVRRVPTHETSVREGFVRAPTRETIPLIAREMSVVRAPTREGFARVPTHEMGTIPLQTREMGVGEGLVRAPTRETGVGEGTLRIVPTRESGTDPLTMRETGVGETTTELVPSHVMEIDHDALVHTGATPPIPFNRQVPAFLGRQSLTEQTPANALMGPPPHFAITAPTPQLAITTPATTSHEVALSEPRHLSPYTEQALASNNLLAPPPPLLALNEPAAGAPMETNHDTSMSSASALVPYQPIATTSMETDHDTSMSSALVPTPMETNHATSMSSALVPVQSTPQALAKPMSQWHLQSAKMQILRPRLAVKRGATSNMGAATKKLQFEKTQSSHEVAPASNANALMAPPAQLAITGPNTQSSHEVAPASNALALMGPPPQLAITAPATTSREIVLSGPRQLSHRPERNLRLDPKKEQLFSKRAMQPYHPSYYNYLPRQRVNTYLHYLKNDDDVSMLNENNDDDGNANVDTDADSAYKCRKCAVTFTSERALIKHRPNCNPRKFFCAYCSKDFSSTSGLRNHMKNIHETPNIRSIQHDHNMKRDPRR